MAASAAGDRQTATGALARLRGCDLADLPRSSSWLVTLHDAAEAAYRLDDVETSVQAYDVLASS